MDEIWKQIKDYPKYEVSNLGNVRNINTKKLLKPRRTTRGYYRVALYLSNSNGKHYGKDMAIHRLVLETFNPTEDKTLTIDHINCNTKDNRLENLRWLSIRDNVRRAQCIKYDLINTDNDKDIIHFDSLYELADALCMPPSTVNWRLSNNRIVSYNNNFYNIRKYE